MASLGKKYSAEILKNNNNKIVRIPAGIDWSDISLLTNALITQETRTQ